MDKTDPFDFRGMAEQAEKDAENFRADRQLEIAHQMAEHAIKGNDFRADLEKLDDDRHNATQAQESKLAVYDYRLERLNNAFNFELVLSLFKQMETRFRVERQPNRLPSCDLLISQPRLDDMVAYAYPVHYVRNKGDFGLESKIARYADGSGNDRISLSKYRRDVPFWVIGERKVSPNEYQYLGMFPRKMVGGTGIHNPDGIACELPWNHDNRDLKDKPNTDEDDQEITLLQPLPSEQNVTLDYKANRFQNATKSWCVLQINTSESLSPTELPLNDPTAYYNDSRGAHEYHLYRPPAKRSTTPEADEVLFVSSLSDEDMESFEVLKHLAAIAGSYHLSDEFVNLGEKYVSCRDSAAKQHKNSLKRLRVNSETPDFLDAALKRDAVQRMTS